MMFLPAASTPIPVVGLVQLRYLRRAHRRRMSRDSAESLGHEPLLGDGELTEARRADRYYFGAAVALTLQLVFWSWALAANIS
jgi:hypothetical protein